MDPKLALKPRIVLEKIFFPLIIEKEVDAEDVENDVKDILIDRVHCRDCTETFSSEAARRRHETGQHKGKRRRFRCSQCEKSYTRAEHLQRHMPSHTGVKAFKCDSCKKQFASRSHLVQHQRTHTNERPYKCTDCNMAFRQLGHLQQHSKQHRRAIQTPLFACSICDKVLASKTSLQSHVRIAHTGETPYKCVECDKTFPSRQLYFFHKQVHHDDSRYECSDCGKPFPALWMMKRHQMIHVNESDYVCPECGKHIRQAQCLKHHMMRHSESQACHICGKVLANLMQLRRHVRCHLLPKGKRRDKSRKMYDCGECERRFGRKCLVVDHFMAVHAKPVRREVKTKMEADFCELKS